MATTTEKVLSVGAWGLEIDHPRNCDVLLQSVPGVRLRGRLLPSRTVKDMRTGEERVPIDQVRHLGLYPEIPGMEIHVSPGKGEYQVRDPLHGNEELCERIRRRLQDRSPIRTGIKIDGVPTNGGKLDPHRIKTLCREMLFLIDAGEARVVRGTVPSMEDIEKLPGDFLLNPGSRIPNTQPTYEKDWDEWVQQLTRSGG